MAGQPGTGMDVTATDWAMEQQFSQALLEKLEPLILNVDRQLRDLGQGQTILQEQMSQLSLELGASQSELDRVHDTFARLPHYIAKVAAMKNTIASVTVQSKKLKKRSDLVVLGREKQLAKAQASRAKEQAYDQTIAAVKGPAGPSTPTASATSPRPLSPGSASPLAKSSVSTATSGGTIFMSPNTSSSSLLAPVRTPIMAESISTTPSRTLPFPLPAKPAFPIVSTTRPPSSASPSPPPSTTASIIMDTASPPQDPVDRFPQVSSSAGGGTDQDDDELAAAISPLAVEVVRLRRKKKTGSKSSLNSTTSTSTTDTKKTSAKVAAATKNKDG
ncbi:hypothetical protein BGZ83_006351 [Gryganskiella cystojenkinii]|nr:hypothetical protein BGZ83_006351 [Gryganskiella cystojenkinii]